MTCCIVNMLNQVRHWIKLFSQLKNKRSFLSSFNETKLATTFYLQGEKKRSNKFYLKIGLET